ncbi:apolipoprotein N-acyltransferase [Vibrio hippocampi]|uniref:Apolipoprotein N-acyltransferase n=1 Tax=Vibrio hippocampi TaxID=654686 RepID=A0ABM8ZII7_9VIBR|nr:apolipoprotein N-acyltransferase [Vibrio hippocampi]CAH0526628.1 Apolipoprotein N-acyltransferase [Vibrio hippocampi]
MKSFLQLLRPIGAAFVGASTTLAFAPYQWWPLAIISVFLLLLLILNQGRRASFAIGYAWGLGQFATGISWVHVSIDTFGGMPKIASLFLMAMLVGYLSIYSALFAWSLNRFFAKQNATRYLLAAPALWLVFDWARGWVMTGFPWLWLGYSQIDSPLGNFAPIGGVELITLIVIIIASSMVYAALQIQWVMLIIPATLIATGFGLNAYQWVTPQPEKSKTVALIQGNIDQALKWLPSQRWPTLMLYTDLTRQNWDADIIIWPEAAIPALEYELPGFLSDLDRVAKANHTSVITGVINRTETGNFYNSVLVVGDTPYGDYQLNVDNRYHKYHLLPFGEFVPFGDLLRPIAPFFNLPMSSFSRGDYVQTNPIASGAHLAPALCYEIIFNEQVRQNITPDTDYILTLSNDAWFGRSIGPLQHMEIARMRALELGLPVIRSTNNGVTALTDHHGKIVEQLPQFEMGVLKAEVTPTAGSTWYRNIGSLPLYLWVAISLLLAYRFHRD